MVDVRTPGLMGYALYDLSEAATLALLPPTTLRRWLLGARKRGIDYPPVLRDATNDDSAVRWGEFIEAVVLRRLRDDRDVRPRKLRAFHERVRGELPGVEYPLASRRVFTSGDRPSIDRLSDIWEPETDTVFPHEAIDVFLEEVEWQDEAIVAYVPRERFPDVWVRLGERFGAPQIRGVRTQSVFSLRQAGHPVDEVAEGLGLSVEDVTHAEEFETDLRGLVAA